MSMLNWILYGFSEFLYINIFTLITLSIINWDKIKNFCCDIRDIMSFNKNMHNLGIMDDDITKETADIVYIDEKIKTLENIYNYFVVYFINALDMLNIFSQHECIRIYLSYANNIYIIIDEFYIVLSETINKNLNFICNEIFQQDLFKIANTKIIKYNKIYTRIKEKQNINPSSKMEDISKLVSNINNMMSFMTNMPKLNDGNNINKLIPFLPSITDKKSLRYSQLYNNSTMDQLIKLDTKKEENVNNKNKNKNKKKNKK